MIATVEELEAVPTGDAIKVADTRWERVEGGWAKDGALVASSLFVGYLAAGKVHRYIRPEAGEWWQTRLTWYLITGCTETEVQYLAWTRAHPEREPKADAYSLDRFTSKAERVEPPEAVLTMDTIVGLALRMVRAEAERAEAVTARASAVTERDRAQQVLEGTRTDLQTLRTLSTDMRRLVVNIQDRM